MAETWDNKAMKGSDIQSALTQVYTDIKAKQDKLPTTGSPSDTYAVNVSGTADHLGAYGYCRCWPYDSNAGKPYALLAQLSVATNSNWGFGQLFKIESRNAFAIFKLTINGTSSAVEDLSVDVLYSVGLTKSDIDKLIVVRYGFTGGSSSASTGAIVNIYTDMSLNLGSIYNRVTLRQLDNQSAGQYSYENWQKAQFYQVGSSSDMVASPTGATVPLSFVSTSVIVELTDNSAFAKISSAVAMKKDVFMVTGEASGQANYTHYVPLVEAVTSGGSYTAFIFSRPRSWKDDSVGVLDTWQCTSSGWTYEGKNVTYADTAGVASTAGTAAGYTNDGGIAVALSGKSNTGHTHDDRYYTEAEVDTAVGLRIPKTPVSVAASGVSGAAYLGGTVTCAYYNLQTPNIPTVASVVNYCTELAYQKLNGMTYLLLNNLSQSLKLQGFANRTDDVDWPMGAVVRVVCWGNYYYYCG